MVGRAVGGTRKSRNARKDEIVDVVSDIVANKSPHATMRMIANQLGFVPSTHLMDMIKELWIDHRLNMLPKVDVKGCVFYAWYPTSTNYERTPLGGLGKAAIVATIDYKGERRR